MPPSRVDRFILLGIDGLDPQILEAMMAAGRLPNCSALREAGSYRRLGTANPPQSPVVWSTIATGGNPGRHGVFDFITRDPANYLPVHSIMKVNSANLLSRREAMFLPVQKGIPFWRLTSEAGIPTSVIRWPLTIPPEKVKGRMLSGLGVPGLKADTGTYLFYTTSLKQFNDVEGKGEVIQVSPSNGIIETYVPGPSKARTSLRISLHDTDSALTITVGDETCSLRVGQWSPWVRVRFDVGVLRHAWGTCRFHLQSVAPDLRLYATPVQVDSFDPAFPISWPDSYAADLAGAIGAYGTLGIPEDTNALNDGCLEDDAFLSLCNDTMSERERMLWHELGSFKTGLLAFVFDTTDRIQHVYWSTRDPKHPAYDEKQAKKYGGVIEDYYLRVDRILGRLRGCVDENTVICISSDHGFASFRRAVHVNSWLAKNGLLVLKRLPEDDEGDPLFKEVAWERTKAYAVGFSSVFLNLRGREMKGIVGPGNEARRVKAQVCDVLLSLRDPRTRAPVFKNVHDGEVLYHGPFVREAPDLVLEFEDGYRASWQTAIGGAPRRILEDNKKRWSGDHMCDIERLSGVLLMNRQFSSPAPHVTDIAPTVLACFGLPASPSMDGTSLLPAGG
jgi:predicted AlkP superfamily phosphohydrolase/phosphomutase